MSYIGYNPDFEPSTETQYSKYTFTATNNQSVFSNTDDYGNALVANDNSEVYLNGSKLAVYDYSINSNILTLVEAATTNDIIEVVTHSEKIFSTTLSSVSTLENLTISARSNVSTHAVLTKYDSNYIGPRSLIRTNPDTISENLTIPSGTNGMTAGPITIANNVTVTIDGSWTIV